MKKILLFSCVCFLTFGFFAQNGQPFCVMDNTSILNNEIYLRDLSCSRSSPYWSDNNLYLPDANQNIIYLKANYIFLTKPDGTGNFEQNNPEHVAFIDGAIQLMNYRLANMINPISNSNCTLDGSFISNTKIQIIVNKIWKPDPGWDFLITGYQKGDPVTRSAVYPPNPNYYYSYLDNDPSIPVGVNIVFANNSEVYESIYVNEDFTTSLDLMAQWAASEFPSTYNLSKKSRQFYPDVFNKYTWFKEVRSVQANVSPLTATNWYKYEMGNHFFPHEFGHSFNLYHTANCVQDIMAYGQGGNTYFNPISQVGKMHRYASTSSIRTYITENSYTNSYIDIINNETWDLDFRLYSDIIVENQSELNLTCKLTLPPQNKITIKDSSRLIINGAEIISANNSSWNGIEIQDDSSLEILPGTEINNNYFYAYTTNYSNQLETKIKGDDPLPLTINNINTLDKNSIYFYPNPSKEFLTINISDYKKEFESTIKITNIEGKLMYKGVLKKETIKLNIDSYKKGIYIISFKTNNNIIFKKFVKI